MASPTLAILGPISSAPTAAPVVQNQTWPHTGGPIRTCRSEAHIPKMKGFSMKPALVLSALIAVALAVSPAKADTFTVSFNGDPLGYSGSGNFVGTLTSLGVYQITSVLAGGSVTDPGFGSSNIVALSTYSGADNLLLYPNGGNYFDANGLAFSLANGVKINLFNFTTGSTLFKAALESSAN